MTEILTHKQQAAQKWKPILEHEAFPEITDRVGRKDRKRAGDLVTVLENTVADMKVNNDHARLFLSEAAPINSMGTSSSTAGSGPIDTYDPIIVSLLRRAMPNLIAYDFCGVQPMTGPTGLVFAKRSRLANQAGTETF